MFSFQQLWRLVREALSCHSSGVIRQYQARLRSAEPRDRRTSSARTGGNALNSLAPHADVCIYIYIYREVRRQQERGFEISDY